ncbi:hypothetical protein RUM43_012353 [Polyplax serrata]|uniref:Uncharacterized protein n=1 Tax=Polyplax serrata TaxID=468196 RepID=A0AAN8NS43_POLSC
MREREKMKEAAYAGKLQVKSLIISTNGTLSVRAGKAGEEWEDEEEGKRTVTAHGRKTQDPTWKLPKRIGSEERRRRASG